MLAAKHIAILLAGFSLAAHGDESVIKSASKKVATPTKPAQPDIKFLEYLGTAEGDGENWTDVGTTDAVPESKASAKATTAKPEVERK